MDLIKPNDGRLVVRPLEEEEIRDSGIIVMRQNLHEAARQGEVMAVSKGCPFKVGKTILFPPNAGDLIRVNIGGKFLELRIIRFESVLASIS